MAVSASAVGILDIGRLTTAPLRIRGEFRFDAPPPVVFAKLADHEDLGAWGPMIGHVTVDTSTCAVGEQDGVGLVRHCSLTGMGEVREEIVAWDPPHGYAYSGLGKRVPLEQHLGVFRLQPDGGGGTVVIWEQYFRAKRTLPGLLFPFMARSIMNRAAANLLKEFGGAGGKAVRVRAT